MESEVLEIGVDDRGTHEGKKELAKEAIRVFPQESIVFHTLTSMPELAEAIASVDGTEVDPAQFEEDSKKFKGILKELHSRAGNATFSSAEGINREESIVFLTKKIEDYNKIIEALK